MKLPTDLGRPLTLDLVMFLPRAILRWFCHHRRLWPDPAGDDDLPGWEGGGHQRVQHGPCFQAAQGQSQFSRNFFPKT